MCPRRPSPEHQEAVSRRLAQLSAELAGVRPEPVDDLDPGLEPGPVDWVAGHTRVATRGPAEPPRLALVESRSEPAPDARSGKEPEPELAPLVPVPGRHAARRTGRVLAGAVPETFRGRVVLGPAQVTVVALLVTVGLAVTCWWVVRADSSEVAAPMLSTAATGLASAAVPAGAPGAPGAPGASQPTDGAGTVTVDVAGKVRRPGIAVLDAGSRVVDAVKAAGGARPGVDLSGLNLARLLVDGEQILVGVPAPAGVAASAVPAPGAPVGPLVNLNTATQPELEALPDVGPVTAQAIISWRTDHGGFSAVDELLEVDGIGDATLGKLAPYVTV